MKWLKFKNGTMVNLDQIVSMAPLSGGEIEAHWADGVEVFTRGSDPEFFAWYDAEFGEKRGVDSGWTIETSGKYLFDPETNLNRYGVHIDTAREKIAKVLRGEL